MDLTKTEKQGSPDIPSPCLGSHRSFCLPLPPILQGLADIPPLPPQESPPPSSRNDSSLANAQGTALRTRITFSLRLSDWWGSWTMSSNPHCTEEQIEAQRGREILLKSHSKCVGRNRLSPPSLAPSPAFQVLAHIHGSSLGGGFGGSLGRCQGQAFMLLPVNRET